MTEVLTPPIGKASTCLRLPSSALTTFCRVEKLGLQVVGQRLGPGPAVLACRIVAADEWCRRCRCQGAPRHSVVRRPAHEPLGRRPTVLLVTVRRYRCAGLDHARRQDATKAADLLTDKQTTRLKTLFASEEHVQVESTWGTFAAPPSGCATSPTTSPDHSAKPAASDPSYTLDCGEPDITGASTPWRGSSTLSP